MPKGLRRGLAGAGRRPEDCNRSVRADHATRETPPQVAPQRVPVLRTLTAERWSVRKEAGAAALRRVHGYVCCRAKLRQKMSYRAHGEATFGTLHFLFLQRAHVIQYFLRGPPERVLNRALVAAVRPPSGSTSDDHDAAFAVADSTEFCSDALQTAAGLRLRRRSGSVWVG